MNQLFELKRQIQNSILELTAVDDEPENIWNAMAELSATLDSQMELLHEDIQLQRSGH